MQCTEHLSDSAVSKADAMKWIAVDWGTSRLRAWLVDGANVVESASSENGMAGLAADGFEPALLALIDPWLESAQDVIACGMVGARQGWVEAPYRTTPCPAAATDLIMAPANDPRLRVNIAPGVSQAAPPDVMRGEETQIAGFLMDLPDFEGVVCLPGTHTKWVHVSASEIVSFRTFMTGEIFALIAEHSVLRNDIGDGWIEDGFLEAVDEAMSRPEALASKLFSLRAESLLEGPAPNAARSRASGLLIGMELAAARPYWLGRDVAILGGGPQSAAYEAALCAQGAPITTASAEAATLRGLIALHNART